jgi:hypothetical protein
MSRHISLLKNKYTYYQGLVPRVPQAASDGLKFCTRPAPSSSKRLGNHIAHTGYDPTTPG